MGIPPSPFTSTAKVSFRLLDVHKSGSVIAIPARPDNPGTLLSYDGGRVIPPIPIKQIAPKYPSKERVDRISRELYPWNYCYLKAYHRMFMW